MAETDVIHFKFEVFGKVQGVFFRKKTKEVCDKNGVTGWVLNTPQGTVQGQIECSGESVTTIKNWLTTIGSPKSKIERCIFVEEKELSERVFKKFSIIRDKKEISKRIFKVDD